MSPRKRIDPSLRRQVTEAGEDGRVVANVKVGRRAQDSTLPGGELLDLLDRVHRETRQLPSSVSFLPLLGAMTVTGSGKLVGGLLDQDVVVSASAEEPSPDTPPPGETPSDTSHDGQPEGPVSPEGDATRTDSVRPPHAIMVWLTRVITTQSRRFMEVYRRPVTFVILLTCFVLLLALLVGAYKFYRDEAVRSSPEYIIASNGGERLASNHDLVEASRRLEEATKLFGTSPGSIALEAAVAARRLGNRAEPANAMHIVNDLVEVARRDREAGSKTPLIPLDSVSGDEFHAMLDLYVALRLSGSSHKETVGVITRAGELQLWSPGVERSRRVEFARRLKDDCR